jgi:pyrroline-5-carboxylate reductase
MEPARSNGLVLVGGGNLGTALLSGLLSGSTPQYEPAQIQVVEHSAERAAYLRTRFGVTVSSLEQAMRSAGTVLIAVKPYHVNAVLAELAESITDHLIISAAGAITTLQIEEAFKVAPAVIRCMPNTPIAVGEGMIALAPGAHATPDDLAQAESLLQTIGRVIQVSEAQLDAVTALSGSGPAYFYYLAEALIDAGVLLGLTRSLAEELIIQTAVGAGLMLRDSDDDPVRLRAAVSSPGGVTIAAVRKLEEGAVRGALMAAAEAGRDRSIAMRAIEEHQWNPSA